MKSTGDKKPASACCAPIDSRSDCCRVEAIISVDERGQMVLPKDLRERAGIGPGEKLAVVSMLKDGEVCCITIIKAGELTAPVKGILDPVMSAFLST